MSRFTHRAPRTQAVPIVAPSLRIVFLLATLLSALIACAAARAGVPLVVREPGGPRREDRFRDEPAVTAGGAE